jgi:imidazolonepropionase-like amidohydrolase
LITIKAAQCLGLEHKLGSLQAGKLADIGIFTLPTSQEGVNYITEEDPYTVLIEGKCGLKELLINGKTVYLEEQGIVSKR